VSSAQLYKPYARSSRWALTGEVGGISPLLSLNFEYAAFQSKKYFITLHGGLGHLFTNYSLYTVPHALTWNILLNGKSRGCSPIISQKPLFAELGLGGVYFVRATGEIKYRWSPVIGVRRYFLYNLRTTGFWKAQLTPLLAGRLVPFGGIGIGIVID
jgi:hypothetical protein